LASVYLRTVGVQIIVALDRTQLHTHTHTPWDLSGRVINPLQRPQSDNTQY